MIFKAFQQMLYHLILTQPSEEGREWISIPILQAKKLRFKEIE